MCEISKKSQFDHLSLLRRQIVHYKSHTRCLFILIGGIPCALASGCTPRPGGTRFIFSKNDYKPRKPGAGPHSLHHPTLRQHGGPPAEGALVWILSSSAGPQL